MVRKASGPFGGRLRAIRQLRRRKLSGLNGPGSIMVGIDLEGVELQGGRPHGSRPAGSNPEERGLARRTPGQPICPGPTFPARSLHPLMISEGRVSAHRSAATQSAPRQSEKPRSCAKPALEADATFCAHGRRNLTGAELDGETVRTDKFFDGARLCLFNSRGEEHGRPAVWGISMSDSELGAGGAGADRHQEQGWRWGNGRPRDGPARPADDIVFPGNANGFNGRTIAASQCPSPIAVHPDRGPARPWVGLSAEIPDDRNNWYGLRDDLLGLRRWTSSRSLEVIPCWQPRA